MEARSGQNHDNKIAPQVIFNPTASNIMDMLCIFVINKQYLFQRVSNYFLATWVICFNYTNTFFIHTMNYFSVVFRIYYFSSVYWELFSPWAENYFRGNAVL